MPSLWQNTLGTSIQCQRVIVWCMWPGGMWKNNMLDETVTNIICAVIGYRPSGTVARNKWMAAGRSHSWMGGLNNRGVQVLKKKSRSHLKILDTRKVMWGKFCADDWQILGTTLQNLVTMVTWCPGFMHLFSAVWFYHKCVEHCRCRTVKPCRELVWKSYKEWFVLASWEGGKSHTCMF